MASDKWIQKALPPSSHGRLHRELHVPMGQKIPEKKIEKAEHSSDLQLARRARLAETLKHMRK